MKVEAGMDQSRHRSDIIELIKRGNINKEYLDKEIMPLLPTMQQRTLLALYNKAISELQIKRENDIE